MVKVWQQDKVINVDLSSLKNNILKHKKENTAYFIKSFYSDLPSWENLINCFSKEAAADGSVIEKAMSKTSGESRIGTVVYKGFYLNVNCETQDLMDYFPGIYKMLIQINTDTSFEFRLSGLKISLMDYHVVPHSDSWDAFAIQAQGVSEWTIKSNDGLYKEDFIVEPGDFLFFPNECIHEINSVGPRSTFIFNSNSIK